MTFPAFGSPTVGDQSTMDEDAKRHFTDTPSLTAHHGSAGKSGPAPGEQGKAATNPKDLEPPKCYL